MANLYVDYCIRFKLPCAGTANPNVILCLQDYHLLLQDECPVTETELTGNNFIEARICQFFNSGDACGSPIWNYRFEYNDELLADPTVTLQTADIAGVFCKDCLVNYINYMAGDEVYIRTEEDDSQTLVSQHGCEYPIVGGTGPEGPPGPEGPAGPPGPGGGGSLLYGEEGLDTYAAVVGVPTSTPVDIGLSIVLPEAGTYLIGVTLFGNVYAASGFPVNLIVTMYDDTLSTNVPYWLEDKVQCKSTTDNVIYTKSAFYTVTQVTTIQVLVGVTNSGYGFIDGANAIGMGSSVLTYLKVADLILT